MTIKSYFPQYLSKIDRFKQRAVYDTAKRVISLVSEFPLTIEGVNDICQYFKESYAPNSARTFIERYRAIMNAYFRDVYDIDNTEDDSIYRRNEQLNSAFKRNLKRVRAERPQKSFLTKEQINDIASLELSGFSKEVRDVFLFQYYNLGLRISDALLIKVGNVKNGIMSYRSKKTKKSFTFAMNEKAQVIYDEYSEGRSDDDYLFSFVESRGAKTTLDSSIISWRGRINKELKNIGVLAKIPFPLETHTARRSFGNAIRDYSINDAQNLLGHSSYSTTQKYMGQLSNLYNNAAKAL